MSKSIGERISNLTLVDTGEAMDAAKSYSLAGWALVNEGTEGPQTWDVLQAHIKKIGTVMLEPNTSAFVAGA